MIKIVMHAHAGGDLEIMGNMQGKVIGQTIYILDSFGLPVEGTETRVNAGAMAYEYQIQYLD
jgi:COP9 signalosome complex subunit 5